MAKKKTRSKTTTAGPDKGDLIPPPALNPDAEESKDALPQQEDFWKPPTRFGSVPVESEPLGWDRRRGFRYWRGHGPLVCRGGRQRRHRRYSG